MFGLITNLKIRSKIVSGFAVVMVILAVVSAMAVINFTSTREQVETYSQRVKVVAIARQLDRDAIDLRRFAREYALTGKDEDAKKTYSIADSMRKQLEFAIGYIKNPERLQRSRDMSQHFEAYMVNFQTVEKQREEMDKLIHTVMDPSGAQFYQLVTSLREEAAHQGESRVSQASVPVLEHGLLARLFANQMIGRRDASFAPKAKHEFEELGAALKTLDAAVGSNGAMAKEMAEIKALVPTYEDAFDRTAALSAKNLDIVEHVNAEIAKQFSEEAAYIRDTGVEEEHRIEAETKSVIDNSRDITSIFAIVGLLIGAAASWLLGSTISKPVVGMTDAMRRLSEGDTSITVPAQDNKDEIGEMAKAMTIFKDNLIANERMRAEQEEQKRRSAEERKAALRKMADNFESQVGSVVQAVTAAAVQLQASSKQMSATAQETSAQATTVSAAAEQASGNVQTVASATDELSASINEISGQVERSQEVSVRANEEANHTTQLIQRLSENVGSIGEIVALINDIASQTNLLALNATIEAARAGDAGKGFAVVASEVKNLANQTGRATEEISQKIAAVQNGTQDAVDAIAAISRVITEVSEISSGVASAVQEQTAATGEIARNVDQAAIGTQEVSRNIGQVEMAARETGNAAEQINESATELSQQAERLKMEVSRFLDQVRTDKDRMAIFHWDESLAVGIPEVDRHHRDIFEQMNGFFTAMMDGSGANVAQNLIGGITSDMTRHFSDEENAMSRANFTGLDKHRSDHQRFLRSLESHVTAMKSGKPEAANAFFEICAEWLREHIQNDDKEFAAFMRSARRA